MKIFDLFSGCGGFRLAAEQNGFESVGYSEINKYAIEFYNNVFEGEINYGDATKIETGTLPDFDLLCAGFPCQSFSIAGKRQGFNDTRGTMFFEVLRVLKDKRPRYFILENVKGLLSHDNGQTFKTILKSLTDLGFYAIEWSVLNSRYFGVPQNRERIFIVGYPRTYGAGKIFPLERANGKNSIGNQKTSVIYWKNSKDKGVEEERQNVGALKTQSDLCRQPLIKQLSRGNNKGKDFEYAPTLTGSKYEFNNLVKAGVLRTFKENKGFREMADCVSPAIIARAREDGDMQPVIKYPRAVLTPARLEKRQNGRRIKDSEEAAFTPTAVDVHGVYYEDIIRRLTPLECFRLQGWPDDLFYKGRGNISDAQLYKLAGNSVTVNVVDEIMKAIKFVDFIEG